jgi:hypothetical protein
MLDYFRTGDPREVRDALAEQLGRSAWTRIAWAAAANDWVKVEQVLHANPQRPPATRLSRL